MSRAPLYLALPGLALVCLVPAPARAQEDAGPAVNYTSDRAYRRFLNSLWSHRAFAAPAPGSQTSGPMAPDAGGALSMPYGYQRGFVDSAPAPSGGHGSPPMSPNFARAYRHFLNSPYSYRTLSSQTPVYVTSLAVPSLSTPYPYGYYRWTFVDPAYTHLRITPRGFEGYTVTPGSRTYTVSPAWFMTTYPQPYGYYPPGP
jgi:hypothetical protein